MTKLLPPPSADSGGPAQQLARYLSDFQQRLRWVLAWRTAALLAAVALSVTLAGGWLAIHEGFSEQLLRAIRALLVALGLLAALLGYVLPRRRLARQRAQAIEALSAEFDGRLATFDALEAQHPFRELLAQDALPIAARHPPSRHRGALHLLWPIALTVLLTSMLVGLGVRGPGVYGTATRALWAGWLGARWLPPQRLRVIPGDQAVRLGDNVTVRAWAEGFDPASAQLHARVGNGPWQQVAMTREGASHGAFAFTFFSARESTRYYVSAAGVRSRAYALRVIEVPRIVQLRLEYDYPQWTHRAASVQIDDGDIRAIAGTEVRLQLRSAAPLVAPEWVIDQVAAPLAASGTLARGTLTVTHDARYYLVARIGNQRVRLTQDYLIKALAVPPPRVQISWPGHDYSASPIEEVSTAVQASDDYGLRALQLRYSVNGGAWEAIDLPIGAQTAAAAEHVFALEDLRTGTELRALSAGDLISYYAVARGHTLQAQSDLYFIDVQPFDRRFSQSQGADGGAGGNEQQQIAERQRQILLSTWNLQRQRASGAALTIADDARLLAGLQSKLAAQAESLAQRTQARQLAGGDSAAARFIASMQQAAQSMQPASAHLAATELVAAIAPEQRALQYLLRAAAQFTDMQVSVQHGGAEAPQTDHELAQLYQLEMDLHKNQYESGDETPQSQPQQEDALARRLQSLAQRQQQLADQLQRSQAPTPEQRWQQQSLQREAQSLQQQLSQRSTRGAVGGTGGTGSSQAANSASDRLSERLASALSAMGEASTAMHADEAARVAQRAQQALSGAGHALAQSRAAQLQQQIGQLAKRAAELYRQQASTAQQVQAGVRAGSLDSHGLLADAGQRQLTEQSRRLSTDVQQLMDQIGAIARQHHDDAPAAASALAAAKRSVEDNALVKRLEVAAEYLDQGAAASIAPQEAATTAALQQLQQRLQIAQGAAAQAASVSVRADPVDDELAHLRSLRKQLQATTGRGTGGGAAAAPDASALRRQVAAGAVALLPLLRAQGSDAQSLAGIARDARALGAAPSDGPALPRAEQLRAQINLLDQLELQLEGPAHAPADVRAAVASPGAEQYQEAVAEYYRRLSLP